MKDKLKSSIKRIGIDARFYGPVGKGLGRYTQEIVDNIIKIDTVNEYVIFLNQDNYDEFKIPKGQEHRIKKVRANTRWYTLAEQIKMPLIILKQNLDLIHFPHFNVPIFCPVKFVVTIHDLILIKHPTKRATTLSPWMYWLKNLAYRINIWITVQRAKKIIAVSKYTKKDLIKTFHIKQDRIAVTYEGVSNLAKGHDSLFSSKLNDKETLLGYNIDKPFLIYVGNAYPHKNLLMLVKVFKQLIQERPDLRLVLVGKEDHFYRELKDQTRQLGLWIQGQAEHSSVVFPGYVPDQELEVMYQKAIAYVFPSLYEGFGLPPLEAMAKGCPVVSSDRTSMPEILGKAALFFDPENEKEIKQALEKIIENQELRQRLIKLGKERVKRYNWWECARQTKEIYNQIL
ncbi:MAG: glycosyltransferase family 1 protein [bacterium]